MKLSRKEITTYISILILLTIIALFLSAVDTYQMITVADRLVLDYVSWMPPVASILYTLTNFLTAAYIFVSERRLGRGGNGIWLWTGLILGLVGFVLYAAWHVIQKADLFLSEDDQLSESTGSASD